MPSNVRNPPAMYGISSNDRCWKVAISRRNVRYAKSFSYSVWGGREAALQHAQAWRDEQIRAHPPMLRRERAMQVTRATTSNVPGVFCRRKPDGTPIGWAAATHIAPGKVLQKWFSVYRYGAAAEALAIAERKKQLEQMTGPYVVSQADRVSISQPPVNPPAPLDAMRYRLETVVSTNTSGAAGVTCIKWPDGSPRAWRAKTGSGASHLRLEKTFYVATHGNDEAKALAIAERRRQIAQFCDASSPDAHPLDGVARGGVAPRSGGTSDG